MADHGYGARVIRLGIPDNFVEHGEQAELYEECGFSPAQIAAAAIKLTKTELIRPVLSGTK
jgi:1-deoxy-D-xylulose-5-phosphate synthase